LQFRNILVRDLVKLNQIHSQYYSDLWLPGLYNILGSGVVEYQGEIVGFGIVKLRPECLIYLDKAKSTRIKSQALLRLYGEAKLVANRYGYGELIAHSNDPEYTKLLTKHLKFEEQIGKLVRLEL